MLAAARDFLRRGLMDDEIENTYVPFSLSCFNTGSGIAAHCRKVTSKGLERNHEHKMETFA